MPKEIILVAGADGSVYKPDGVGAEPGDRIILPEKFTGVYIANLQGTPEAPIVITNKGGVSFGINGIDLNSPKNVVIDGGGESSIDKGIVIDNNSGPDENDAFKVHGYAEGVRIARVASYNNDYGARIKNEASCDQKLNAHVIMGITIEDSEFINSKWQHLYAGSTNLNGTAPGRQIYCDGKPTPVPPPQMGNVIIRRNNYDKSGRAAVQISQAMHGFGALVTDNKIRRSGREIVGQGNGMNFGLSRLQVENNDIDETLGVGIAAYACPQVNLKNNTINHSGFIDGVYSTIWAWGIWIDDDDIDPRIPIIFDIEGNKIGVRGLGGPLDKGWKDIQIGKRFALGAGLPLGVDTYGKGNIFRGNVSTVTGQPATAYIAPGIDWSEGVPAPNPVPVPPPVPVDLYPWLKFPFTTTKSSKRLKAKLRISKDGTWKYL